MYDYGGITLICRDGWLRKKRKRRNRAAGVAFLILFALASYRYVHRALPTGKEPVIRLWRADIGQVVEMPLEQYVAGVVAAEMPVDFSLEALKAGAVAARSYALYEMEKRRSDSVAHVSSDYRTSQAWLSPSSLVERWGAKKYLLGWPKIKLAVTVTRGQVMTYQGKVIQALYHSTSGGVTANSEDYFIAAVPYLRSVPSPWETHSPYWQTTVALTEESVLEKLGVSQGSEEAAGQPLVEVVDSYETGRTKSVRVGSITLSSREVREKLGLRSAWFTVACEDGIVTFFLKGNGHGVGMSQYGADGLARLGYKYDAILRHYYQGAKLQKLY